MNRILITLLLGISLSPFAAADEWNADQQNLWEFVAASWDDDTRKTGKWPGDYVDDGALTWDAEWPVPRDMDSMARWTKFRDKRTEVLAYELFPHDVIVNGDTGVVFYSVVEVRQLSDDSVERSVSGIVETAVRSGKTWKYVALTSFEMQADD